MWTEEDYNKLEKGLKKFLSEENKCTTLNSNVKSDCMHDNCPNCHGTGINKLGGMCVHGISCPCSKCRTS